MKKESFNFGDIIIHRGGTKYIILNTDAVLEENAAPAYSYRSIEGKPEYWQRLKNEMEDGRFVSYEPDANERRKALSIFHYTIDFKY